MYGELARLWLSLLFEAVNLVYKRNGGVSLSFQTKYCLQFEFPNELLIKCKFPNVMVYQCKPSFLEEGR